MIHHFIAAMLITTSGSANTVETTPAAFVTGIYKMYRKSDADILGRDAPKVFSPALLKLIRADKPPGGEVGNLDYDPICDCQDSEGLRLLSVTIKTTSSNRVHAISRFRISTTDVQVDLSLIKTPLGWRVDEVDATGKASLRAVLAGDPHKS